MLVVVVAGLNEVELVVGAFAGFIISSKDIEALVLYLASVLPGFVSRLSQDFRWGLNPHQS